MGLKMERIDFRLASEQKELIERAASLLGTSLSAFAVSALLERANQVVTSQQITRLSLNDSKAFLQLLTEDKEPNSNLKKAFKRHLDKK